MFNKRLTLILVFVAAFFAVMHGVAQDVNVFDPSSWFVSVEAVLLAGSLLTPFITKVFTALGKDWFHTEGRATQWLSLAVAVIIAGVGGYFALGYFAGVAGLTGALQSIIMVAAAFLGSNGLAKNERQVAAAAIKRVTEEK